VLYCTINKYYKLIDKMPNLAYNSFMVGCVTGSGGFSRKSLTQLNIDHCGAYGSVFYDNMVKNMNKIK
jgi:hypothetical protein